MRRSVAGRNAPRRGACADVEFVDGAALCEIDDNDLTTDADGEVSLTVPDPIIEGTDTTVWIWTGRDGDEVGRSTDLFRLDVEPSTQTRSAVKAEITTGFRGSKARFGTTVTFTLQLKDAQGNSVSVGANGEGPAEWELVEELLEETDVDGDTADGSGERLLSKTPRTVRSDSRGRVTFSLSVADPDRSSVGQSRTRVFKLVPGTNAPTNVDVDWDNMSSGRSGGEVYYLEFSDALPVLANSVVSVTVADPYKDAPTSGSVRNSVTVSVFDEYGEALTAATVTLVSDSDDSTVSSGSVSVGRSGVRRFSYSYSGDGYEVETLTATVDPDGTGSADSLDPKNAYMFWPALTEEIDTNSAKFAILFGDVEGNEIIVDTEAANAGGGWPVSQGGSETVPERVVYDSNDRFDVQGSGDAAPVPVSGIEAFETALAEFLAKTPESDAGVGACLEWSNYTGRSRNVAEFKLWTTCS